MAQKPAPYKIMNRDMAKSAYEARSQNFVLGIIYWLLTTLVLTLGFGQLLRFDFYGIPLYLHDVLVIAILIVLFLQGQALQVRKLDLRGLALLGAGLILSSARAIALYPLSSLLVPALYMMRLLAYLSLYLILKSNKIVIPNNIFLISGLTTITIGLIQYFFMPDMRWAQYLGWDDHLSRLSLPHYDPTFTGVMLGLVGLTFPMYLPIFFIGILLSYSRSVWISLVLTGAFFIKNKRSLIFAISFLLLAILILPKKFGEGTNLLRTYSISSRVESDIGYIQKYNWDLLTGRGMNTTILDSKPSIFSDHATGPNNSYLYLLTTTGVLGLVGWGIFMFSLYKSSIHKYALAFFFIASLFNNVMFYPFALLWILLLEATTAQNVI